MTSAEPPDSWTVWAELAGVAAVGFAFGIVVGYVRAPRAQRKAVNEYVMERVSDRTRTVLAILRVSTGYWDHEIELELEHPGDIVQEAIVLPDRRRGIVPVQEERRGAYSKPDIAPTPHHPAAF